MKRTLRLISKRVIVVVDMIECRIVKDDIYSDFPMIEEFCREAKNKWVTCVGALSTLIDICEEDALREKNKTKIEEAVNVRTSPLFSFLWILFQDKKLSI
jgi:hypothetical protein